MPVVYVSGPMTATDGWEQEKNMRVAEEAWFELAKAGVAAICPHTMGRHFMGTLTHDRWMALDLELLSACSCILVVGDYERICKSKGTAEEIEFAKGHGMPVFYSLSDAIIWCRKGNNKGSVK